MEVNGIRITDLFIDYVTVPYEDQFISAYFLEVATNKGILGFYGPIRQSSVAVQLATMRETIKGLNPIATERIWNKVFSSTQFGGRTGIWMMALGALDCALWDIKGKIFQVPVFELLGGPCREKIPCYASCMGFDEEGAEVPKIVKQMENEGYLAQKWALRKKESGDSLSRNIQSAKRICDSSSQKVMFEILGSWAISQTKEFCNQMKSYSIGWIEEPIPSEMLLSSLIDLKDINIPIAAGEHIYNRFEAYSLLTSKLIDYFQLDIGWCGGITESIRIVAMSSTLGIPLIPHGHNFLPGLHLAFAYAPETIPMLEYHITIEPRRQIFYKHPVKPKNGSISLPEQPGLGTELTPHFLKREKLIEPKVSK
ncbi:mandelate racemase/muconate lactonizing enzyme family protein [Shimazuella sp. AN120528]|uniref:mandelate racemase/muconate lactonizing enzyme family protein n=1 Tax=Shimazuella soli TaxID=1892854 RepID=UPI001F0FFC8D|nr:mandelate racemase/muconate lactonizing enzyme family protein [Shimazuella soli]MCH5584859.1 mandelate racemase/muconate lactonizing enzyme family protein [Shimazuella soli]